MKEFIHKVRQIFMSTRVIENRLKYQILCGGCSVIHIVFMILMLIGHSYPLFGLNLLAVIFYAAFGFYLAVKEKYRLLFVLAFIEVQLNSSISCILLGEGYGFMIYTLSLIPGAFYLANTWPAETKNKYGISMIPIVATWVVGIMYILVDLLNTVIPPVYHSGAMVNLRPAFHYFNILIAVLLLLVFSILFALEVRYIQKLLNDENSRLGEIAFRDPLTKAYNRRSLHHIMTEEIENNEQLEFGLIILDIDDFKKVNDTYGHSVGDLVLIQIAAVMKESLRDGDYFCRWGGEEFMLMIHGTADDCAIVAERVREGIAAQVFHANDVEFSVTATLGIAEYQTGIQIRTLVDLADQKLYFGKKHGKNQVVK